MKELQKHFHCLINKWCSFNTLKKYVEVILFIDLTALEIINEKSLYLGTGNSNSLNLDFV